VTFIIDCNFSRMWRESRDLFPPLFEILRVRQLRICRIKPTQRSLSPHIDKDSREQFEIRTAQAPDRRPRPDLEDG